MSRTILVGAHLEHADGDAVGLAVALARPFGASLVLGAVHVPSGSGAEADQHARLEGEVAELRAAVPADVAVTSRTIDATSVVRGLHELAVDCDAELLVLGSHHRSGFIRALRGDTAAEVAFSAPCGVVVANPADRRGMPKRVAVAWDQTPAADQALKWAIEFVRRAEGELRILRVLDPSHPEGTHPGTHDQVRLRAVEEETQLRVTDARAEVIWGDAAPELIKASHGVDLLVMGSRTHGPVRRLLVGSTSTRVLHEAHCPVVVIPEAARSDAEAASA